MANKKTNKTKKTTTRTKAKTADKSMQYADGKDNRKELAKTVEELMSINARDPFSVASGESFEDAIGSMSLTELQEIAVKSGVFPSGTKATLKNLSLIHI